MKFKAEFWFIENNAKGLSYEKETLCFIQYAC